MSQLTEQLRLECIGSAATKAAERIDTLERAMREALSLIGREYGADSSIVDQAADILEEALQS